MLNPSTTCLVVEAVSIGLVGALTVPSFLSLATRLISSQQGYQPVDALYEDEDGKATATSQRRYSTLVSRSVSIVAVLLGSIASLICAVLASVGIASGAVAENWIRFGSFVCICWVKFSRIRVLIL